MLRAVLHVADGRGPWRVAALGRRRGESGRDPQIGAIERTMTAQRVSDDEKAVLSLQLDR